MPSKRFVFLGQNTSPAIWASSLCSCGGPRSTFRSLQGWTAKLLWVASTGKEAEGCEPRGCMVLAGIAPQCWQFVREQSLAPPELQTAATLFPGWASGWVMWVFFNQEGYWIQETAGADHLDFPGSRLCGCKSLLQDIKTETRTFTSCIN